MVVMKERWFFQPILIDKRDEHVLDDHCFGPLKFPFCVVDVTAD
ncbi:hypothetical protein [Bacillus sp. ISL-35]|nr:hypothetical protein [Bacillus sp. ISL-35]